MKKIILFFIMSLFLSLSVLQAAKPMTDGDGTETDPYEIWTVSDLIQLKDEINAGDDKVGKYYIIMADIDMSDVANWDVTSPFAGKLDGNYHILSNFYGHSGLFNYTTISAEICNIILKDARIYHLTTKSVGGIADVNRGSIYNCYSTLTIEPTTNIGSAQANGGIVGTNSGLIENCFSNLTLGGIFDRVGAIAGSNGYSIVERSAEIRNCYSIGSIKTPGRTYIGGIMGQNSAVDGQVISCVNLTDTIIGGASTKRIFTQYTTGGESNYSLNTTLLNGTAISGTTSDQNGENITVEQARSQSFYENIGWDFVNIWKMSHPLGIYKGYPIFKGMKDEFDFNRLYVNQANQNNSIKDGLSWESAYSRLEDALSFVVDNPGIIEEIWVAQGIYTPELNSSYTMQNKLCIYGGFLGTETDLSSRVWENNHTILQGNNNSVIRNVFTSDEPLDTTAILDGFIITNGLALSTEIYGGGGIYNEYASPVIQNCIIEYCTAFSGGGVFNYISDPLFRNVTIRNNTAIDDGAGIENVESSPVFSNVSILNNYTEDGEGGGIYNSGGEPLFINVKILGNKAYTGGGIYNMGTDATFFNIQLTGNVANTGGGLYNTNYSNTFLTNATISGNFAESGGGIHNSSSKNSVLAKTYIKNSIIWGNRSISASSANIYNTPSRPVCYVGVEYSLVENLSSISSVTNSGNNIEADPLFVSYQYASNIYTPITAGNYRLTLYSLAINSGNNSYNPTLQDIDGNYRIIRDNIDMGAFEFQFARSIMISEQTDENEYFISKDANEMNTSMVIYPNPVTTGNQITVEIETPSDKYEGITLEVFNILGNKVGQYQITEKTTTIIIPDIKGQYIFKANFIDATAIVKKIIVI